MRNNIIAAAVAIGVMAGLSLKGAAQSSGFKQGQWIEIQNAVIRNLNQYYVDSLPVDRMYKAGIDKMLESLDPYTVYVPEEEQEGFEMMISNTYGGIGAIINKPSRNAYVAINEPYANSPAARAGLQCGDRILEIDGQTVVGLEVGEASSRMKGKPGTQVRFKVVKVRTNDTVDVKIEREKIHMPNVEYSGILEDGQTGYIYQTGFTAGTMEEVRDAVVALKEKGMTRLVLDLRGNGGGLMDEAVKIVSLFVPKGTVVVTSRGTDGVHEYATSSDPIDTNLPLMVLVDSGSASASEIVAGAVQDLDRGIVAGRRTFGKGLVQRILPLPYKGQLKVTLAKYYTPSGRCVQAKDYSHRAEDGSVGNIPDSLTREFKTLVKKRTVRDGGGITPDFTVSSPKYNRITYAVVMSGITQTYPLEYVKTHDSIAPAAEFHLSDEEYEAFVDWAVEQKFDSRSESETYFDLMVAQMKEDGDYEAVSEQLAAVEKVVKMEKRASLMRSRAAIQPLVEEEIAVRYHYQWAAVEIRLRTDDQLREALKHFE